MSQSSNSMKPKNRVSLLRLIVLLLVFCTATFVSNEANAQRDPDRPNIEDLLPETTVAFVQIEDIRDLIEKTSEGAGAMMMQDESVAPLVERVVEEGRKAYGKVEENVGLSLDELASIPSGEMVLCAIAPRRKKPVFMVILEVGEENEVIDKAMGIVDEKMTEAGVEKSDEELESGTTVEKIKIDDNDVFIARRDGLIIGCSSEKVLNNFFLRWDGEQVKKVRPLSQNRKFITIMNRCRSKKDLPNDIRFFFDPISLIKSAGRGDIGTQTAIALFPAIGLDSVLGMGGSMILGDDEYETIMHAHLLLSSPRKGITKMFSLKPGDYEPELWMPDDAFFYTTTSWDVPQMLDELRGILDLAVEEGTLDNFIKENIDDRLGMSLEDDILSELTGRISFTQVSVDPGKLNSASWVVGFSLNDPDSARGTIETLVEWLNENANSNFVEETYEGVSYWAVSQESMDERAERRRERREERRLRRGEEEQDDSREMLRQTVRMPRPNFSIIGGSLVICDSIEAFEKVVSTYKGELPSLANNEDFVTMAEQMTRLLGTDMPVALSYSQPKNQLQPILDYANAESTKSYLSSQAENNEFWGTVKNVLDDHELPSMEVLNKYIVPQGWFITSDDTGYHMLWFQERLKFEE